MKSPKRRFENLFDGLVLLPELASDRVEVTPSRARSHGIEATVRYEPNELFDAWLSYSRSRAQDRIDSVWAYRAWDQSDTLSGGLLWQHGPWSLGTTVLWHSGWRTTQLPDRITQDETPTLGRNRNRLRDFLSWNVRVARTWIRDNQSFLFYGEITNLLNRNNVGAIEYDVEIDEENGDFLVTSEPETLLPLVPSIGFEWRF